MSTRSRLGYINAEQKEILIEFMKVHKELQSGKFSATFTAKAAQGMWMLLAGELHKIPNGAIKYWKQWRKTWQDLCSKTKAKHSQIKKYTKGTGGGPSISHSEQLICTEQQVLETLNTTAISGHDDIIETGVSFEFENVEFLDEYTHILHPESENLEATNMNTNDEQATTCIAQNCHTDNEAEIVRNKENIEMVNNNRRKKKDKIIEKVCVENMTEVYNTKNKEQLCKQKRTVASDRLERTMEYTNSLVFLTKEDQQMMKKYYRKKLKLLKRNITLKERLVNTLENMCNVSFIKH